MVENNTGSPEYLDEFSFDFSTEQQCPFPPLGVWAPAVNNLGQVFLSEINGGASVTVLQGCGAFPLPTATGTFTSTPTVTFTPTITPTPSPTSLTHTPTPPDVPCKQSYAYPNPLSGNTLKIHLQLCQPGQATVFIYNTAGELVTQPSNVGAQGPNDFNLQVSGWSYGIYYYIIQVVDASGSRRLKPQKFAIVR